MRDVFQLQLLLFDDRNIGHENYIVLGLLLCAQHRADVHLYRIACAIGTPALHFTTPVAVVLDTIHDRLE